MENIFKGFSPEKLEGAKFAMEHFYYGKDLKHKSIRKFYKIILKSMWKEYYKEINKRSKT